MKIIKEQWNKVSDVTFEGFGEAMDTVTHNISGYESLRLLAMSGEIFYLAKAEHDQLPVAFKLVNKTDSTFRV